MKKKPAALPAKVSAEDALRLRCAMQQIDLVKAQFALELAKVAHALDAAKAEVWPRYSLAPDDEVNVETGAISRAVK